MKRKIGAVLLKVILIQILVLSLTISFVALVNYTVKNRNTSDDLVVSDTVSVKKRDVIRSVYGYRLPLSGRVGRIALDREQEKTQKNKKKHAKKKESVNIHKDRSKSHKKLKSEHLFNETFTGNQRLESGQHKADKNHAELKQAKRKHAELKRAEQKHAENGHRKQKHTELGQSKHNHVELNRKEQKHAELKHIKQKHANRTHIEGKDFGQNRLKPKRPEQKQVDKKHFYLIGVDIEDFRKQAKHVTHHPNTSQAKKKKKTE